MRHAKRRHQLNRFTSWRKATLKSILRSLVIHQSIRTTKARAKAAKPLADRLISLAKENTLAAKRRAYSILGEHRLVSLLFGEIGPRFNKRLGGYTRIVELGPRRGDDARMVIFELTEIKKKEPKKPKEKKETKPEEPRQAPEEKIAEKPPVKKKPSGHFLGGLRRIFKKERDAL
jgi:large subunit ribosomal protein L17